MARIQHNAKLNRLVADLGRSLLQFLGEVSLWTPTSASAARETLDRAVKGQQNRVNQMSELLVSRGTPVNFGSYPASYTDLHFLSLKSLLPRLISSQESLIAELDEVVHTCADDDEMVTLLRDILSAEKASTAELKAMSI